MGVKIGLKIHWERGVFLASRDERCALGSRACDRLEAHQVGGGCRVCCCPHQLSLSSPPTTACLNSHCRRQKGHFCSAWLCSHLRHRGRSGSKQAGLSKLLMEATGALKRVA